MLPPPGPPHDTRPASGHRPQLLPHRRRRTAAGGAARARRRAGDHWNSSTPGRGNCAASSPDLRGHGSTRAGRPAGAADLPPACGRCRGPGERAGRALGCGGPGHLDGRGGRRRTGGPRHHHHPGDAAHQARLAVVTEAPEPRPLPVIGRLLHHHLHPGPASCSPAPARSQAVNRTSPAACRPDWPSLTIRTRRGDGTGWSPSRPMRRAGRGRSADPDPRRGAGPGAPAPDR